MQAILLSAGRGQRLAPLTDTVPKPLVKAKNKALIDYQLEKLAAANVSKVVINTGWLGQQVIDHVGSGKRYGLRVVYSVEPQIALETGGGIFQALPLLDDEQFIVCNADVYHEFDFSQLSSINLQTNDAHLVLIDNPAHNPSGDFSLSDNLVIAKSKEHSSKDSPKENPSQENSSKTLTYGGIGLYSKRFFSECKRGRFGLGKMLHEKLELSLISGEYFSGTWFDVGTVERLKKVEAYLQSK